MRSPPLPFQRLSCCVCTSSRNLYLLLGWLAADENGDMSIIQLDQNDLSHTLLLIVPSTVIVCRWNTASFVIPIRDEL